LGVNPFGVCMPGAAMSAGQEHLDVRTALKRGIAELRDANVPSYTLAAELLLLHVLGRDRTWLYAHPEEVIPGLDAHRFLSLILRRAAGEPTQYITGKQEFWGLEFEVTPDVLIPRPETEHVIEVALDRLALREIRAGRKQTLTGEGLNIIDVGTGSGCIAIALAKELPGAQIVATDISVAALAVARRNAARHAFSECIQFIECNLLNEATISDVLPTVVGAHYAAPLQVNVSTVDAAHPRQFDLIVSNPPYVGRNEKDSLMREVRDHEPEQALYGGEEGYELYADLIAQAAQHLKPDGILVLELGHNSLPAVQPLLDLPEWTNVGVTKDLAGIDRVIAAEST
ncbi:MAG TPA: peptide chain release factor N(5)-glutamine methyltransferase, partial [Candidatus Acidoferrum sp.]|nr:peptide chain release factor N(5)-glutamine methyltransferase [Candidatus Acidoferrum sp.]